MAMPLDWAMKTTRYELLTASGRRWAEAVVPEQPFQLEMRIFGDVALSGAPDEVLVTVHLRGKHAEIGAGTVGGWWKTWNMPAPAGESRFALHGASGLECGSLRFSANRRRLEVLDCDGNPRVVVSLDQEPAGAGERFRGALCTRDRQTAVVHAAVRDGAAPRGRTVETEPPKHPVMHSHVPAFTQLELLAASGAAWALVSVPDDASGASIALLVPAAAGPPAAIASLTLGFSGTDVEIDGGLVAQAHIVWSPTETSRFLLPAREPGGAHMIAADATLAWNDNRTRVALRDGDDIARVVLSLAPEPSEPRERLRLALRRPRSARDALHLLVIDGTAPAGITRRVTPPVMPP
jgi:hypothetical protein